MIMIMKCNNSFRCASYLGSLVPMLTFKHLNGINMFPVCHDNVSNVDMEVCQDWGDWLGLDGCYMVV